MFFLFYHIACARSLVIVLMSMLISHTSLHAILCFLFCFSLGSCLFRKYVSLFSTKYMSFYIQGAWKSNRTLKCSSVLSIKFNLNFLKNWRKFYCRSTSQSLRNWLPKINYQFHYKSILKLSSEKQVFCTNLTKRLIMQLLKILVGVRVCMQFSQPCIHTLNFQLAKD